MSHLQIPLFSVGHHPIVWFGHEPIKQQIVPLTDRPCLGRRIVGRRPTGRLVRPVICIMCRHSVLNIGGISHQPVSVIGGCDWTVECVCVKLCVRIKRCGVYTLVDDGDSESDEDNNRNDDDDGDNDDSDDNDDDNNLL